MLLKVFEAFCITVEFELNLGAERQCAHADEHCIFGHELEILFDGINQARVSNVCICWNKDCS